jgi:hypothetical protein
MQSSTDLIVLSDLITGEQAGGSWTRTSSSEETLMLQGNFFTPGFELHLYVCSHNFRKCTVCNDASVVTIALPRHHLLPI